MKSDPEVRSAARAGRAAAGAEAMRAQEPSSVSGYSRTLDASPAQAAQRQALQAVFGDVAQRQSIEEEEPLQGRFEVAQRAEPEEELQMKADPAAGAADRGGLPGGLRAGIESLSGIAMDDVSVHYGSSQPAQLNALAYAQGSDIHLAPGQEQHLPHEAWHVVQQRQGRVAPTMQMAGVGINDDAGLEREADTMGARALSQGPAQRRREDD